MERSEAPRTPRSARTAPTPAKATNATPGAATSPHRGYGETLTAMGRLIHGLRIANGWKSPGLFCAEVEARTGRPLKVDTLQRIEAGRQEPKVLDFAAISYTLGALRDPLLTAAIDGRL